MTRYVKIAGFSLKSSLAKILFSIFAIIGEAGMAITYPLWIDSTVSPNLPLPAMGNNGSHNVTKSNNAHNHSQVDAFFVFLFSTMVFVLVYGMAYLFQCLTGYGTNRSAIFHRQFILAAFFTTVSGILMSISSSGTITAPSLRAIIINAALPFTIIIRYVKIKFPNR